MRLSKLTLTKDSPHQTLTESLMLACRMGFLDYKKNLEEKTSKAIISALCDKSMARHNKALVAAYKMGFEQAKNQ